MARLYGNPTKLVRHSIDTGQIELDAQESLLINFWHTDTSTSAVPDGTDTNHGQVNTGIPLPLGSRVTKHKVTTTIEPSTIEPQNLYLGTVQLSFHDILAPAICGQQFDSTGRQGIITEDNLTDFEPESPLRFYPDSTNLKSEWDTNVHGTKDIDTIKFQQLNSKWMNLKKVTLFDQRPLIGERWQRIPKKVKRANPYTWYGLVLVNDSRTTGEVVQVQVQQYLEEWQMETPPTTLYT